MGNRAINAPLAKAQTFSEWVWFGGAVELLEGQGLCYDWDYGTATSVDFSRSNRVEVPTILNAPYWAGVAARAYPAVPTGQFIEINLPGSTCNILSRVSNTVGVGRTCCVAGGTYAGYFDKAGYPGAGNATPSQTVDRSSTAGKCQAKLEVGPQSGLIELNPLTAAGTAITCMVGGITYFDTALTLAADATFTLADGVVIGQKKGFCCMATMTTNDIVITVTSGVQGASNDLPTTALATITLDADEEEVTLEWRGITAAGGKWYVEGFFGSVMS